MTKPRALKTRDAQSTPPTGPEELGEFVRGDALICKTACIIDDPGARALYEELTAPVIADLEAEFGATRASTKILIMAAATTFVDGMLATQAARRASMRDRDPVAAAQAENAGRRAEKAMKLSLMFLEALRRPTPESIRVAIAQVDNMNILATEAPIRSRRQ